MRCGREGFSPSQSQAMTAVSKPSGWLLYRDHNRNSRFDAGEPLLQTQSLDPLQVSIRSNNGRRRVTYRSLGESEGANTTFILCSRLEPARGRQVIVANSGRVRLLDQAPATGCTP